MQSKKMNYGDGNAIMILAAVQMGLNPPLVDEAKRYLEGGSIHIIIAKGMEDAAVQVNDQLRNDASLIEQANECANRIKSQYGFV